MADPIKEELDELHSAYKLIDQMPNSIFTEGGKEKIKSDFYMNALENIQKKIAERNE